MNIAYYIHSLAVGGAESVVTNYLIQLQGKNHVILIVNYLDGNSFLAKKLQDRGVKIYSLLQGPNVIVFKGIDKIFNTKLDCSRKFDKILKTEKIDVLHIHTSIDLIRTSRFDKTRTVITFHSEVKRYFDIIGSKNLEYMRNFAQSGASFIAINYKMKDDITSLFDTNKVNYIPNGIDFENIRKLCGFREVNRKALGFNSSTFVIGNVSRFNRVKNHEKLINIFSELYKRNSDSVLVMVGGDDDNRQEIIRKMAVKNGIDNCIRMPGAVENPWKYMSAFDVMVIPSFSESFSLVAIEAQSMGIPCICSEAVPDEVLVNDNCCKLTLNEPLNIWVDAIVNSKITTNRKAVQRFSISNIIAEHEHLYKGLIQGNKTKI